MKHRRTAFFTFLLCLALIVLPALSCGEAQVEETPEEPDETETIVLAADGVSDFYVIRSDYGRGTEVNAAVRLRTGLMEKSGAEVGISTDWEKNPVYEHELIVGKTTREADSPIDRIALGETGYVIREQDGKIFIAGGSEAGTMLAVDFFLKRFVDSGELAVPVGYERIMYHQYDIQELYVGMNRVDAGWKILVDGSDKKLTAAAEKLKQAIYAKTGLMLTVGTGAEGASNAFILSSKKPVEEGAHEMLVDGSSFIFRSGSASNGVASVVDIFIKLYMTDAYGRYNFPSDYRYLDLGDYMIVRYPDQKK